MLLKQPKWEITSGSSAKGGPMARYGRLLTGAQWGKIGPCSRNGATSKGKTAKDDRKVLEGILWILRSGARWQDLPEEFPSPSTCWRRLRDWEGQGVWLTIWRAFLAELNQHGQLDWSESFLDGSFASAKKGGESRKNQAGQGHEVDGGGRGEGVPLESSFTLLPRTKSGSLKRRSRRSA